MHPALDAGDDARGNAVLRKLVALVFAEDDRLEDELSAIDRQIIELEARQCRLTLTQRLLGEDEDRTLILLGDVECVDRDVERLLHRPGRRSGGSGCFAPSSSAARSTVRPGRTR